MKIIISFFLLATLSFANINEQCDVLFEKISGNKIDREIFIIVDKTTPFPENIRTDSLINIISIIKPRTAVSIFTFSEYKKDKHIDFIDRYHFNATLSKGNEYDMSKKKIRFYKNCLKAENNGLKRKIANDIYDNFKSDGENYDNSEILYSLKKISKEAISLTRAKEKIVFILSDMLENSSYTSFYKEELKNLDIDKEINIVHKNKLFGNFSGADIVVVGAGIVGNKKGYVDGKDQDSLREFWELYFKESNAKLKVFSTEINYPIKNMYE